MCPPPAPAALRLRSNAKCVLNAPLSAAAVVVAGGLPAPVDARDGVLSVDVSALVGRRDDRGGVDGPLGAAEGTGEVPIDQCCCCC